MTSTTYSRTGGKAVLPGTWQAVKARHDIDPNQLLDPAERYDYDTASDDTRKEFVRLAQDALTEPPTFLRFALASNNEPIADYPGAGTAGQFVVPGHLGKIDPSVVIAKLNISEGQLNFALTTFSGEVRLVALSAGTTVYRTVGLTANPSGTGRGLITNRMLGEFWEPICPSSYADEAAWRSATAVLAEWNGDYGYIEVELKQDVWVLSGTVGQQNIPRTNNPVLPGGGQQLYIPNFTESCIVEHMAGRPIKDLIKQTRFGENP